MVNRAARCSSFLTSEREFSYKSFPDGDPAINDIHDVNYTLTLQHDLSQRWTMLTMVTPGLASDFEADLSSDDFTFEVAAILVRRFSEQFSFGFGAAYSTQFGEPIPLPVLAFDWNNGTNLSWNTILPVSSELWYQSSERLQLGLVLGVDGNNYRGDRQKRAKMAEIVTRPRLQRGQGDPAGFQRLAPAGSLTG